LARPAPPFFRRVIDAAGGTSGGAMIIVKPGQKKKMQHIYRGLHKKLQENNQKILRNCPIYRDLYKKFIEIYIRNCKKIGLEPGRVSGVVGP